MKSTDQATRCPACKTVFRVVADQLRVSAGWVRCGRCTNVFNAAENMVDMDGSWARAPNEPGTVQEAPSDGYRQPAGHRDGAGPLPDPDAPLDSWHLPRTQPHRARQDGPDNDRLASKIEAALLRGQQPQPPIDRYDGPSTAPIQGAGGAMASAPGAAFAPVSGLTFRRSAGQPRAQQGPAATQPQRPAAWEPDPADDAGPPAPAGPDWAPAGPDWAPAATTPSAPTPASVQAVDEPAALARQAEPGAPAAQPASWAAQPSPEARQEPAALPPPGPWPEPSAFDETRPESLWPATQSASSIEDPRADTRNGAPLRPSAKPGFMRRAEREQNWRQPHMQALLMGALAASALLLVVQVSVAYRDLLSARYPATKPVMQALCAVLGCTVQAARSIESLAVESSGLVRVDKTPLYKLQITLRNRANLELALPALDVTFTDSKGAVISRKVLLPQDLGRTIASAGSGAAGADALGVTVAAGQEVVLQGTLQTSAATQQAVAGYTVELFYP